MVPVVTAAPPAPPRRRTFTVRFVLILLSVGVAVTGVSALVTISILARGVTQQVPEVTGKTLIQAAKVLTRDGFLVRQQDTAFHETIPQGIIISQDPPAGASLKKGRAVRVVVSSGPALEPVPDLAGRAWRDAEVTLKESRLRLGDISKAYAPDAAEGIVIAQNPAAGTSRSRDSQVHLLVSLGPRPQAYFMPDLTQKKWPEAHTVLTGAKLVLGKVTSEPRADVEKQTVLEQEPAFGERVTEGTPVQLTVAAPLDKGDAAFQTVSFHVPDEGKEKRVRITVIDERGSREIYNDMAVAGQTILPQAGLYGQTLAQFFVNNELVEERWVQQ